ncbi:MFS transporter [Christensenella intestinihominis]|uniref:MFS transporter n=1 Tax=Christensenella intestinihominis TaxID=1851429 RepID=UPI001F2F01DB|nr:MFS transporter [Christensenella intestinihominis]
MATGKDYGSMKNKLFSRDFTIMIAGQIISLFGNAILRFALSLYVLDQTGSATAFGIILAISMIPMVVGAPFGGILADRVSRKRIMVALDYITAAVIGVLGLLIQAGGVTVIAALMFVMVLIQAFYQPAVQASVPLLASGENLVRANGVVVQVNALANLLGPIIGGFLYGFFGLWPILAVGFGCFLASATMELFLHIPFMPRKREQGIMDMIKSDTGGAMRFLLRENPSMLKLLLLVAALNLFMSAMFTVGLPYLVKIFLGLSNQLYGFVEGAMAVGSIMGGVLAGAVVKRVRFTAASRFLFGATLCLVPLGFAVAGNGMPLMSYGVIIASVVICLCCTTLFSVIAQAFIQQITPNEMLGKVMSFVTMFCTCAYPLGQAMYGFLFGIDSLAPAVVVGMAGVASLLIAFAAGKTLKRFAENEGDGIAPEGLAEPAKLG